MMSEFDEKLGAMQSQLSRLRAEGDSRQKQQQHKPGETVATQTLAELQSAVEELHVADEELRQQNDELIAHREALESERYRYVDLFEFAPDGYLVTDLFGVVREANRAAGSLLNIEPRFLV